MFWCIRDGLLSPPPAGSGKGFFFDIYSGNLIELLEVKLTKVCAPKAPTRD